MSWLIAIVVVLIPFVIGQLLVEAKEERDEEERLRWTFRQ